MAYRGQSTKYGNKTTAQIAAGLPNPQVGDTVFNTDYAEVEWWNGLTWLSNNSIQVIAGETLVEGNVVYINGNAKVLKALQANSLRGAGIVQYGGALNQAVSLRTSGVAKCLVAAGGSLSIGSNAGISGTTPGTVSNTASSSVVIGNLGRNLQAASANTLGYVFLTFLHRY